MSYLQVLETINSHDIILASKSPRRQELLRELGIIFSVAADDEIDEMFPAAMAGSDIPLYLARKKAAHYHQLLEKNSILITADTVVWHEKSLMPKPHDVHEAKAILGLLSGKMHEVFTGVCIKSLSKHTEFFSGTCVYFKKLTEEEIDYYVQRFKPMDKAGAYGIQEWIGYIGVEKIVGSFYNVMGLPVQQLFQKLVDFVT